MIWPWLVVVLLGLQCLRMIYRLYLHPLARFPGPKLAAATHLYGAYWTLIKGGQYTLILPELHRKYGPIVRIYPDELHIHEMDAYNEVLSVGTKFDKQAQFYDHPLLEESHFNMSDLKSSKSRREMFAPFLSKAAVSRGEPLIQTTIMKFIDILREYGNDNRGDQCRTIAIKAVAKHNGLDLDICEMPRTPDHLSISKLGKVPAFQGADGFKLFECMAIALYITSQNEETQLLGENKKEYAEIIKWMSFFNTEIVILMTQMLLPQIGIIPYDKDQVELFTNMTQRSVDVVEEYLQNRTFLVGEKASLADLFCAGNISLGFQFFYGKTWREKNPNVSRWYEMVCHLPIYAAVTEKFQLLDEPKLTNNPPGEEA